MKTISWLGLVIDAILLTLTLHTAIAGDVSLSAAPGTTNIVLSWTTPTSAGNTLIEVRLYRKRPTDTNWVTLLASWTNNFVTNYTDNTCSTGLLYQYEIGAHFTHTSGGILYHDFAYDPVFTGINLEVPAKRGNLLVLVDSRFTNSLAPEINRFLTDLSGDGWDVCATNVPGGLHLYTNYYQLLPNYQPVPGTYRSDFDYDTNSSSISSPPTSSAWSNAVHSLKAFINDYHQTKPLDAMIFLGHTPTAYSGTVAPNHDHIYDRMAYPADIYFADVNNLATWADTFNGGVGPTWYENRNDPNDGRFDLDTYYTSPGPIFGRIDFFGMGGALAEGLIPAGYWQSNSVPTFAAWPFLSEIEREREFLRRYLNKEHNFRNSLKSYGRSGLLQESPMAFQRPWETNEFKKVFGDARESWETNSFFVNATANTYLWGEWNSIAYSPTWENTQEPDAYSGSIYGNGGYFEFNPQIVFTTTFSSDKNEWGFADSWLRSVLCDSDTLGSYFF